MRTGTANTYDKGLDQLLQRQSELASQQEQLSSGKRVNRASDDPVSAAQAERATVRIRRVETDQRALEMQRNAITAAESTLGQANALMQTARDLVISSGNLANTPQQRGIIAGQLIGLRDQALALANRTDSNGVPLFGSLGSVGTPFVDASGGVVFQAVAGQRASTATALPPAMDGQAIWMDVQSGNGVFEVSLSAANTGTVSTGAGSVESPTALSGNNYSVTFTVAAGVTTYAVVNTTTAAVVATGQPYREGAPIQFDGMSVVVRGIPADGDTLGVAPSTRISVFDVLDHAIASINNMAANNKLSQGIALALAQFDTSLDKLQSARSQTGDWLNRADSITNAQGAQTILLEGDRSRAQDLDMVKGISDFNQKQTGYQAALQSYAQIQKLSLFNFIN